MSVLASAEVFIPIELVVCRPEFDVEKQNPAPYFKSEIHISLLSFVGRRLAEGGRGPRSKDLAGRWVEIVEEGCRVRVALRAALPPELEHGAAIHLAGEDFERVPSRVCLAKKTPDGRANHLPKKSTDVLPTQR